VGEQRFDAVEEGHADRFGIGEAARRHRAVAQHDEVVDARSSRGTGPVPGLYVNVVVSLAAGAALAVTATSGIPGILRVWGTWAIVSGIVQLIVGTRRRALGGQWPMILSGALSAVAGTVFIPQAAQDHATLSTLTGYAAAAVGGVGVGGGVAGVFFLVSALRLGRSATNAAG
jgi:uncharacterized membrane protein HdeD (DUF308 family)